MQVPFMIVTIIALLILGSPVYLALLSGCVVYFVGSPTLSIFMLPQKMINAMDSFTFLAIPFFLIAGQIMNRGGITKRIFHFSDTLVGRFRGGLGYVNILGSFIFSGMSGSALADIGGLGQIEIQAMREAGFDDDFSIGITAASSTIGPIVPPSLPFVTYALFANVSLGSLFMAGFVPGFVMVITLGIMTFFITCKRKYPRGVKYSMKEVFKAFCSSFWALLSPVLLIGGIWGGMVTPTEAALVSVLYSLFIGLFVYKDITLKEIPEILIESFKAIAPICAINVASVVLAFIINYEGLDSVIYNLIANVTTNKYVFLLLINLFLLVVGMVLDPSASMVVLIPILAPVARAFGIDLIHFGIIFCLNMMIGLLTPPVGMSLYLLSSTNNKPFKEIRRAVAPWLIPLFVALLVVTYWEGFVLFIPRLFGY